MHYRRLNLTHACTSFYCCCGDKRNNKKKKQNKHKRKEEVVKTQRCKKKKGNSNVARTKLTKVMPLCLCLFVARNNYCYFRAWFFLSTLTWAMALFVAVFRRLLKERDKRRKWGKECEKYLAVYLGSIPFFFRRFPRGTVQCLSETNWNKMIFDI